jgi:uroporphyrinogen III methyltransferase/synthase
VRAFGVGPELVPSGEQSSLGLLDEFPSTTHFRPGQPVLLPRADIATETLAEACVTAAEDRASPPTAPCARLPPPAEPAR